MLPTLFGTVLSGTLSRDPVLELGWFGVVRQTAVNTCGPAVIATLLSWRGIETTDSEVAAEVELRPQGVSLADFARLATEFGVPGRWFKATHLDELEGLPLPVVVHLRGSFGHFAILRADAGSHVHLADPARGNVLVPKARFLREWTGRSFILSSVPE